MTTLLSLSETPDALPQLKGRVVSIEDASKRKAYREAFRALMKAMSGLIEFDRGAEGSCRDDVIISPNRYPYVASHEMEEAVSELLYPYLDPDWVHGKEFSITALKECVAYLRYVEDMTTSEIVEMVKGV